MNYPMKKIFRQTSIGVVLLLSFLATIASAKPFASSNFFEAYRVSETCGEVFSVDIISKDKPFDEGDPEFQTFLNGLKVVLSFECVEAQKLSFRIFEENTNARGGKTLVADGRYDFINQDISLTAQSNVKSQPMAVAPARRGEVNVAEGATPSGNRGDPAEVLDKQKPPSKTSLQPLNIEYFGHFHDIEAGEYMQALYVGDFETLRALDRDYTQLARDFYGQSLAPLNTIIDMFTGLNYSGALQQQIEASTLLVPIFGKYLVDYPFMYKECLDYNAHRFSVTTTSWTVYKNGWGTEVDRVRHPDRVEYFDVNRRFGYVFENIYESAESSNDLAVVMDNFLNSSSQVGLGDVFMGTRQTMNKFSCDSSVVRQLETNMLAYFDIYLQNYDEARKALFE